MFTSPISVPSSEKRCLIVAQDLSDATEFINETGNSGVWQHAPSGRDFLRIEKRRWPDADATG